MKVITFYILIALCLVYGGLTLLEGALYRKWERTQNEQAQIHHQLAYLQQLNGLTEHLLHDMAIVSQRDPTMAELLKKRQIKVIVTPRQAAPDAAPPSAPGVTTPTPPSLPHP